MEVSSVTTTVSNVDSTAPLREATSGFLNLPHNILTVEIDFLRP
jgi:hypothetical protein